MLTRQRIHSLPLGPFRRGRAASAPESGAESSSRINEPTSSVGEMLTLRAGTRLSPTLTRLFGADCPLCHGPGCHECAFTGLR
jgi:hypothetical protein